MINTTAELQRAVSAALSKDDFGGALGHVASVLERAFRTSHEQRLLNHGSVAVDALCRTIGEKAMRTPHLWGGTIPAAKPAAPHLDVYIASEIHRSGGHTPLIGDYVRANENRTSVILHTDYKNLRLHIDDEIGKRICRERADLRICTENGLEEKFVWLANNLLALAPARVFLFQHMSDVAPAACLTLPLQTEWCLVHHCDRVPCAGAMTGDITHIDLTPFCFRRCRNVNGQSSNRYIPLTAADLGRRCLDTWPEEMPLTTASSGAMFKFAPDHHRPSYVSTVAKLLEKTGGTHVHIGDATEAYASEFRHELDAHNVEQDRLILVPYVSSVWQAMSEYGIDLYLNSFPTGGARTSVEVMGSGTPMMWFCEPGTPWHRFASLKYPQAQIWSSVDELLRIVDRIHPAWLTLHSGFARAQYDRMHSEAVLKRAVNAEAPMLPPEPAPIARETDPPVVEFDELLAMSKVD